MFHIFAVAHQPTTANGPTPHVVRDRLQDLPSFMQRQILAFFGYKDYALTTRVSHYLQTRWTEAMANRRMTGTVFFPDSGCTTLYEAVDKVREGRRLTTIVVGKGEHNVEGYYLDIRSAINIVGDPSVPKSEIVVVGGIQCKQGNTGNCHLQHLTLRQAKECGVVGFSSFSMEDVLVEHCRFSGVYAYGTGGVGRCTNVEVRQCGQGGVEADNGGSITLLGAKTMVHHNCTKGRSNDYGLNVHGSSSTIQLVSPLTKEQVSLDNGGGGNWGAEWGGDINQIKSMTKAEFAATTAQLAKPIF